MRRQIARRAAVLFCFFALPLPSATAADEIRDLLVEAERLLTLAHPGGDKAPAIALLRQAVELGDPVARLRAAQLTGGAPGTSWLIEPTAETVAAVTARADADDAIAQGVLATSYLLGAGIDKDALRAAELYERALGRYVWATHNLGWMYSVGEGVEQDLELAFELWRVGSADNPCSEYELGFRYISGNGTPQDVTKGLALLRQAAARGHVPSIGEIGRVLSFGLYGVPTDLTRGPGRLKAAADAGFHHAMSNLGVLYLEGPESVRDLAAAQRWFGKCATTLPVCANYLGYMLAYGHGSSIDVDGALKWLVEATLGGDLYAFGHLMEVEGANELSEEQDKRVLAEFEAAAKADNAAAQGALATLLWEGRFGSDYNSQRSFELARKGAEGGSAQAMQVLATQYWNGFGTKEDQSEAVAWWRRAAEAGDRQAAFRLGDKYLRGTGVAVDRQEGIVWLEHSAANGWGQAHVLLAEMHEYGWFDTEVDLEIASRWYTSGAELGNFLARGWLRADEELED